MLQIFAALPTMNANLALLDPKKFCYHHFSLLTLGLLPFFSGFLTRRIVISHPSTPQPPSTNLQGFPSKVVEHTVRAAVPTPPHNTPPGCPPTVWKIPPLVLLHLPLENRLPRQGGGSVFGSRYLPTNPIFIENRHFWALASGGGVPWHTPIPDPHPMGVESAHPQSKVCTCLKKKPVCKTALFCWQRMQLIEKLMQLLTGCNCSKRQA